MNTLITLLIILVIIYIIFTFFSKITKFILIGGIIIVTGLLIFQVFTEDTTDQQPIIIVNDTIEENNITEIPELNTTEDLVQSNFTDSQEETG